MSMGCHARQLAFGLSALLAVAASSGSAAAPSHTVAFDAHSFLIDGRRTYLWSGEFHPYRLPSPVLWKDIFQKMKAAGFNTASIYFSWGYHSPAEGRYDFSGVRDMDRLLDAARDAGVYVIARPGPYINAEVDSGGFPLWLATKKIRNRSSDPDYLRYSDQWLTEIDRIIARHQLSDGRGTVIAYQIENEFYDGSEAGRDYIEHLERKARADRIVVPLVGNHNGTFATGRGAMEVSGWDHYPQGFDCSNPAVWRPAPDMSRERTPGQPLFTAEFQGGAFDPWGGPGYAKCAALIDDRFANVFYKENIAAGATAQNFYMVYGGTSWGWQAIPQNYSSYDYGAAITEARQFDPKYFEDKRIGYFVTSVAPLLKTDAAAPGWTDNPEIVDLARTNPDTGTQFHLLRHGDTTSDRPAATRLTFRLDGRSMTIPQKPGTSIGLDGRQSKILVADYAFGRQRLLYSTSEIMTAGTTGGRDVIVLYGNHGGAGEAVLASNSKLTVHALAGHVDVVRDPGRLRLDYSHDDLIEILIEGGARPLLVLIADRQSTEAIWRQDIPEGPIFVVGSHLLRSAQLTGSTLALEGDVAQDGRILLIGPKTTKVTWNGAAVPTRQTPVGRTADLATAVPVSLPPLDHWERRQGAPEIATAFDDGGWRVADRRETSSVTPIGEGPSLLADDYGFHTGNTWYRGHFRGGADAPAGIRLRVISGGKAGAYSAWLNGHFLGSVTTSEDGAFAFPQALLRPDNNVLSVLTVNMGHEEDYQSKGENRTGRGIASAKLLGARSEAITWRIQGRLGGEGASDPVRGPYNLGGLAGERAGWTDGLGDQRDWSPASLPAADNEAGVTWYRTSVRLDLPKDQDTSLGLEIKDPSGRHYRATIFVNGWQMGNYVSDLGPQTRFPVPSGVIDPHGQNQIVIAVWKTDETPGGLGQVSLFSYASVKSPPLDERRH